MSTSTKSKRKKSKKSKSQSKKKNLKRKRSPSKVSSSSKSTPRKRLKSSNKKYKLNAGPPLHEPDYEEYTGDFHRPTHQWKSGERVYKMKYTDQGYHIYCFCLTQMSVFKRDRDKLYCDVCDKLIPFKAHFLGCTQGIYFIHSIYFIYK